MIIGRGSGEKLDRGDTSFDARHLVRGIERLGHHRHRSAGGVTHTHEDETPLTGGIGIEHVQLAVGQPTHGIEVDTGKGHFLTHRPQQMA